MILLLNFSLVAYTYKIFINETEELSTKEAERIHLEISTKLTEIEEIINYLKKIIDLNDTPRDITSKLIRMHNISSNATNEFNTNLSGIYCFLESSQKLFSRYGEINNDLYKQINSDAKSSPEKLLINPIPNNMNFNGVIISKGLKSNSDQYIGSIHILLTDILLESIIKNKVAKENRYLVISKYGNLIAASDKALITSYQEKIDISYGVPFLKFSKYILPYKKVFFLDEFTLWSGVYFYPLWNSYKHGLLNHIITLNAAVISLIILYYILLIRGIDLGYKQLKADNKKLNEQFKDAQNRVLNSNTEIDSLKKYVDIFKLNCMIESDFIKEITDFIRIKSNDSISTSILLKKYIDETLNAHSSTSLKKILDLVNIIIYQKEGHFFDKLMDTKNQLKLSEVLSTVIKFYTKISYEKNITIKAKCLEDFDEIFIEHKSLEYILISIIAHMLKGVGKNAEINIETYKTIEKNKKMLEISLSDNGFGVNIDDIFFDNNNASINILGATAMFLSSIEELNKALQKIGGKIIIQNDKNTVNRGTKYILHLPTKVEVAKSTKTRNEGNVIYLHQ